MFKQKQVSQNLYTNRYNVHFGYLSDLAVRFFIVLERKNKSRMG